MYNGIYPHWNHKNSCQPVPILLSCVNVTIHIINMIIITVVVVVVVVVVLSLLELMFGHPLLLTSM